MNFLNFKHTEDKFGLIICNTENHDNNSVFELIHEFNLKPNTKKLRN